MSRPSVPEHGSRALPSLPGLRKRMFRPCLANTAWRQRERLGSGLREGKSGQGGKGADQLARCRRQIFSSVRCGRTDWKSVTDLPLRPVKRALAVAEFVRIRRREPNSHEFGYGRTDWQIRPTR